MGGAGRRGSARLRSSNPFGRRAESHFTKPRDEPCVAGPENGRRVPLDHAPRKRSDVGDWPGSKFIGEFGPERGNGVAGKIAGRFGQTKTPDANLMAISAGHTKSHRGI